jgi:hypothetical protein
MPKSPHRGQGPLAPHSLACPFGDPTILPRFFLGGAKVSGEGKTVKVKTEGKKSDSHKRPFKQEQETSL